MLSYPVPRLNESPGEKYAVSLLAACFWVNMLVTDIAFVLVNEISTYMTPNSSDQATRKVYREKKGLNQRNIPSTISALQQRGFIYPTSQLGHRNWGFVQGLARVRSFEALSFRQFLALSLRLYRPRSTCCLLPGSAELLSA